METPKQNSSKILLEEPETPNSLSEPIKTTLLRDISQIQSKLSFYFLQKEKTFSHHQIKDYELWGPFLFTLIFSVSNSIHSIQIEENFSLIIIFLIFGFFGLIINSKLLNMKISYLEGVSIFGYLIFPLSVAALFNCFFSFLPSFLKILVVFLGLGVSVRSSYFLFQRVVSEDKVFVVLFPVLLFECCLTWFVVFAQWLMFFWIYFEFLLFFVILNFVFFLFF